MAEEKFDARLAEGVAYFEQMLSIMPEDRTTLEFLVVAYEQMGELEKQQKALVSLTRLLIKDDDRQALQGLLPRLETLESHEAKALALKVKMITAPQPELVPEAPRELSNEEIAAEISRKAIKAEISLVEQMFNGGVISAEEAENLKAQLESMPCDGRIFLISALQILEKENATLAEKCVAFLADQYGIPPIPLTAFDITAAQVKEWPEARLRIRGALPFAKLGKVSLVALLNPGDEELKKAFNQHVPCRFYLADPAAVEAALAKLYAKEGEQV